MSGSTKCLQNPRSSIVAAFLSPRAHIARRAIIRGTAFVDAPGRPASSLEAKEWRNYWRAGNCLRDCLRDCLRSVPGDSRYATEVVRANPKAVRAKCLRHFRPHVFGGLSWMAGETGGARHSNHEPRARGLNYAATMELRGSWRQAVSSFLSSQRGSHGLPKQPSGRTLSPDGFSPLRSANSL